MVALPNLSSSGTLSALLFPYLSLSASSVFPVVLSPLRAALETTGVRAIIIA